MARSTTKYELNEEMRRLADALYELHELYKVDDAKTSLAALKEARMLAALAYEVESGGRIGEAAGAALLSIAHREKIVDAIGKRKRTALPLEGTIIDIGGNGNARTVDE